MVTSLSEMFGQTLAKKSNGDFDMMTDMITFESLNQQNEIDFTNKLVCFLMCGYF